MAGNIPGRFRLDPPPKTLPIPSPLEPKPGRATDEIYRLPSICPSQPQTHVSADLSTVQLNSATAEAGLGSFDGEPGMAPQHGNMGSSGMH